MKTTKTFVSAQPPASNSFDKMKRLDVLLSVWSLSLFCSAAALPVHDEAFREPVNWFNGGTFERKCLLFKNCYLSDVKLLVKDGSVNEKSYLTIPSHKTIISIYSLVFEMHFNKTNQTVNRIFVENVSVDIFDIVLK